MVLFTNGPGLFDPTYQRYLLKYLREHTPFREVPLKMHLRGKSKTEPLPVEWIQEAESAPAIAPPPRTQPVVDLSELEFTSKVTDEEMERAAKRKNKDLWDI